MQRFDGLNYGFRWLYSALGGESNEHLSAAKLQICRVPGDVHPLYKFFIYIYLHC
jgi:hypothetical protein